MKSNKFNNIGLEFKKGFHKYTARFYYLFSYESTFEDKRSNKIMCDMIIENYYIREKQDLNNRLENKLQPKNKEKVKKI